MKHDRCIVCGGEAAAMLGIRARWSNTNAAWAPNLNSYLCREHALSGAEIEITYRPTDDGHVRVTTHGPEGRDARADLEIGSGKQRPPGQGGLF